jgi:hypothetical protein
LATNQNRSSTQQGSSRRSDRLCANVCYLSIRSESSLIRQFETTVSTCPCNRQGIPRGFTCRECPELKCFLPRATSRTKSQTTLLPFQFQVNTERQQRSTRRDRKMDFVREAGTVTFLQRSRRRRRFHQDLQTEQNPNSRHQGRPLSRTLNVPALFLNP